MSGQRSPLVSGAARPRLLVLVATVGLLGSLVMAQAIAARSVWRIDLTPDQAYTLSPHAQAILTGLHREVRVIAFLRAEDPRNRDIEDLLRRAAAASERFRYQTVDINRSPAIAREYGVQADAALAVESAGRRRVVTNPSEVVLMTALLQVTRPVDKPVYFLTGHGERSVEDADRKRGYSAAGVALRAELYNVRPLTLLGQARVPADAAVVIVAGPQADLLPDELQALQAHLTQGGSVLVLLDPGQAPNLVALLAGFNVVVRDDVVVDPDNRLFAGDFLTMVISERSPQQLVSATLAAPPLFSQARPVELRPEGNESGGIELLHAGPTSWRTRDREVLRSGTGRFVPEQDHRGPVSVAVAMHLPGAAPEQPAARLMVIGDSDFANNFFLEYLGNKDLFVNAVNWLAREEQLVAIRTPRQEPGVNQFFISARQGRVAFWIGTVVQPAIFLAIGLAVYLRRQFNG